MDVGVDLDPEASYAFGNRISLTTGNTSTAWAANYFSIPPLTSNPGVTATTTYSYDNNGNVTQVGTTTSYTYDYQNRLTQSAIGNGHATTTTSYAYGPFGERVSQTTASSTTIYPNKLYSVTTFINGTTTATSTDYVYAGSNLLATVDQALVNGTATGTPITRYNHTDNLGSTNVTSDANMGVAQWFDYAPYGTVIATTNTGATNAGRQYIGQFTDNSGLNYLNARYYNGAQGQFTTQDPVFWGTQNLSDPQSLNSYAYSEDNPIVKSDPNGKCFEDFCVVEILAVYSVAHMAVDYYDWWNMNYRYPKGSTQSQKDETALNVDFDWLSLGVGRALGQAGLDIARTGLDAMSAAYDAAKTISSSVQNSDSGSGSANQSSSNNSNWYTLPSMTLFTTPSGAIVTGGGVLISPPPHSTNQGTNQKGNSSSGSSGSGNSGAGGSSSGSGSSGSNGSNNGFVPSTSGSAGSLFVCHAAGGC